MPPRSRNASSIEMGSKTGVKASKMARIWRDTEAYRLMREGSQIASGHRRSAVTAGMADRTPKGRAS